MSNKYFKNILIFCFILIFFLIKKSFASEAHSNLISLLELNYPLEFTFEQKYKNDKLEGWMIIIGNGMVRTEFAPPNNNLIVADGKWIMFYDPEIERTTYIPLDKGIFKAFLKPKILSEDKIFTIIEKLEKNKLIFTLEFNMNNANQKIIIYFDKISKRLEGWRLYESLSEYIEVNILDYKKFPISNVKNLQNLFKVTKSKSDIGMEYLGPFKDRKLKKILKGRELN